MSLSAGSSIALPTESFRDRLEVLSKTLKPVATTSFLPALSLSTTPVSKMNSVYRIASRKFDPTFRQSNTWRPSRDARSTQTSVPRQLFPYGSRRGE
jgi:hypothetical protein